MREPDKLDAAGRELWNHISKDFDLSPHEAALLEEACRTRDRIAQMRSQVSTDGVMLPSSQGLRLHPAISEERSQRLALARLLATLAVPGLDDDLPSARRVRGVYTTGTIR